MAVKTVKTLHEYCNETPLFLHDRGLTRIWWGIFLGAGASPKATEAGTKPEVAILVQDRGK